MMNVLQIQDDLKNFSEDQLVREMQQPSGNCTSVSCFVRVK